MEIQLCIVQHSLQVDLLRIWGKVGGGRGSQEEKGGKEEEGLEGEGGEKQGREKGGRGT